MKKIFSSIIILSLFIISFGAGYWIKEKTSKDIHQEEFFKLCESYKKELDGLYLKNWKEESVKNYTKTKDPRGDWICVNVRGINFSRGIEVCQHECGHAVYSEIYAEICEKNMTKCMDALQ